ncbi:MAG: SGNH/GDSL hydrolase family protein [Candidatus Omnitrophota bacterium]
MKERFSTKALILLGSLFLVFLALEIAIRTYHAYLRHIPFFRSIAYYHESELGWNGKLIWGDPNSKKFKIFFIGDSFTNGSRIEEKYMYYSIIKDKLDAEIFVYGGGAYGSLQEYLALDKYFDKVKPNLVVLQVCDNDFINNSWKLETKSLFYNDFKVRPYLINGKLEYRYPLNGNIKMFLAHSRFFLTVLNRICRLSGILTEKGLLSGCVEKEIYEKGTDFEDFREAAKITDEIISKLNKRVGKTPLIAFAVDDSQPFFQEFRRIFKKNGVNFIEEVPRAILEAQERGQAVRLENGHFNEIGNKICGQVLTEALTKGKFIR